MDYENKYKQALSRATFYNNELLTENQRKMLLDIFPELTMSEDERMKDYIKDVIQAAIIPKKENKQKMIAWLEKQERALNPDEVIEWLKSKVYDDSAYGMAMIEQFKKDFQL